MQSTEIEARFSPDSLHQGLENRSCTPPAAPKSRSIAKETARHAPVSDVEFSGPVGNRGLPAHIVPMRESDLLITGFEAFPGVAENPTMRLIQSLPDSRHETLRRSRTLVLPTRYGHAPDSLVIALDPAPRVLIMTGYSRKATTPVIETRASNRCAPDLVDAGGDLPAGNRDGTEHLEGTCDSQALGRRLAEAGIRAELSDDAGSYVCNHLYYNALRMVKVRQMQTRALFLHLPALTGTPLALDSAGAMSLVEMQQALGIIADEMLR